MGCCGIAGWKVLRGKPFPNLREFVDQKIRAIKQATQDPTDENLVRCLDVLYSMYHFPGMTEQQQASILESMEDLYKIKTHEKAE